MSMIHHELLMARKRRADGEFAAADAPRHYPPDLRLEPVHTVIELSVDIDQEQAQGVVTHTVEAHAEGQLSLTLDAVELDVRGVQDEHGQPLSWVYDGRALQVRWEQPWRAQERRQVAILYSVTKPKSGLFFSKPDASYPQAAYYAATDHETERARHWLPTIDLPSVRCTLELRLRAPAHLTILANGQLSQELTHEDGTKTAIWTLDFPCPSYLICFALGEFTRVEDGQFEGKPLAYFGARDKTPEDLLRSFGRTQAMLAWMTQKLDMPFPFPKYYQFALPAFGGAMENISLVSWDDIFVLDETLAQEWTWLLDQINVHEMAHSYFGDAVVCRDYAHAWLKESWATYIETCWLEDTKGPQERDYDFWRDQKAYFDEADHQYKRPLVTNQFESSWRMYDRHLYPGGAARLHMLRCWLGDEVFWSGVRAYLREHVGKTVETPDFRRAMERASGRSLVRFFEQWIHSPGYPDLKAEFAWDEDRRQATWTLTQQQVKASQGKEPTFVIDMKVGWTLDGEHHVHAFTLERETQQVTLTLARKPDMVRVDPLNEVVHKLSFDPGQDLLLRQLTQAPDVVGRILAGQGLAKAASRKGLEALDAAYDAEPFWGVREQWAKALGQVNTAQAAQIMARWVAMEADPMVLEPLMQAADKLRDERVFDALIARVEAGLPYRACQAAYAALGAYGAQAPLERLKAAASTASGYGDWPQQGALRGLARSRQAEAGPLLIARSSYGGASTHARRAAATALGQWAASREGVLREEAIDHLEGLLRDPNDRVRMAAAHGLKAARATRAAGSIEAYARTLSHQERADVLELLAGLRESRDPKVGELEEALDKLKGAYRELLERLERLEDARQAATP